MVWILRRSLVSPWILGFYLGVVVIIAAIWLFSELPLESESGPLSFLDAFLIFAIAGLLLALGVDREWRRPMRSGYMLGTVLALGIGVIQLVGLLDGETPMVEELDTGNTLCWLIAGGFLVWMLRSSGRMRAAERFLVLGFALQSFSLVADVTDGMAVELPDLFDWLFGPGEEISEVLFLATYCCGFALLANRSTAEAMQWRQQGLRASDMLEPASVIKRANLALRWQQCSVVERAVRASLAVVAPALFAAELAYHVMRNGRRIRDGFDKPRLRQSLETITLGITAGVPPANYYKFDLFAERNRRLAQHYLHDREFNRTTGINALFGPSAYATPAGETVDFTAYCPLQGWPEISALDAGPRARRSGSNHPVLQKLAGGKRAMLRLITCLDENGRPEITHALLRFPKSDGKAARENQSDSITAAVSLRRGKLGWATDLGLAASIGWVRIHPNTGAVITGRIIPLWREAKALALRAHECCLDRTVVEWEIAILTDRAELVERHDAPDLDIIQRAHSRPLGLDRLGRLLAYHIRDNLR